MDVRSIPGAGQAPPIQPGGSRPGSSERSSPSGDRIEISDSARRAACADGLAREVLDLPETRPGVVEAARRALARGELDAPQAARAAARALVEGA
jgi:hypothetical protein